MDKKLDNSKKSGKARKRAIFDTSPLTLGIVHRLMEDALKQRARIQKDAEVIFKIHQPQIIAMVEAANHAAKVIVQMNEMLQASEHVFQRMLEAQRDLHERVITMVRVMDFPRIIQDMDRINSIVNARQVRVIEPQRKSDVVHVPTRIVDEGAIVERIEERLWARINAAAKPAQISGSRKALPGKIATVDLYLTPSGKLYKIPNYKVCYNFVAQNRNALKEKKDNKRLKLIKYLTHGKGEFTHTTSIQSYTNSTTEAATRKSISTMNIKIGSRLGLKQPLFDHSQGSGYRINPVYKVIIADEKVDL